MRLRGRPGPGISGGMMKYVTCTRRGSLYQINTPIFEPNPDVRCALGITLACEVRLRPDRACARPGGYVITTVYQNANSHATSKNTLSLYLR